MWDNNCTILKECPICKEQDISEYKYKVANNLSGDKHLYSLSYCNKCHHLFSNPRLLPEYLIKLYDETYKKGALIIAERNNFAFKLIKLSYLFSRNFIRFKKGDRLLDVGCNNGMYMDFVKERGVEVYGNDINEYQLKIVMKRFDKEKVKIGELKDNSWNDEFFDYVTLWHQLEHDFDPATTIKEVYRILKPNSKVIIDIPNIDSIERSVFGRYWSMYGLPFHLNHFSQKSITKLLEKNNFSVSEIRFTFFKPMEFSLSLLFSFTKRFNLNLSPRFKFFWIFFLFPFVLPFDLICSLLRKSSTMIVIAAKNNYVSTGKNYKN